MDGLLYDIAIAFWVFLPAGIANLAPVLAAKVPRLKNWKIPLDFGKSYRGHRIFGDNKTWRGLTSGVAAAGLTGIAQSYVHFDAHPLVNQPLITLFLASMALGLGALLGDAVESHFKRRAGLTPGQTWFPFDQTDYIIGGLLLWGPIAQPSLQIILAIFGVYFGLHLAVSYIGFHLGLKEKPV